jgi:hypothetical protein
MANNDTMPMCVDEKICAAKMTHARVHTHTHPIFMPHVQHQVVDRLKIRESAALSETERITRNARYEETQTGWVGLLWLSRRYAVEHECECKVNVPKWCTRYNASNQRSSRDERDETDSHALGVVDSLRPLRCSVK